MYRTLFFFAALIIPAIFGWWIFVLMAILNVYLARLPYEIILAGFILDFFYYFGNGFLATHALFLFSTILIILAFFLSSRVHWRKII
jgi:hypothetical protein